MTNEKPVDRQVPSRPRLFYIDNLRILLTILVILHHLAIIYGGSGGGCRIGKMARWAWYLPS